MRVTTHLDEVDANWGSCELTGAEENDRQFRLLFWVFCAQAMASRLSIGLIQSEDGEGRAGRTTVMTCGLDVVLACCCVRQDVGREGWKVGIQ